MFSPFAFNTITAKLGFMLARRLKRLPPMRETWVRSLGWEDPLEEEMVTHSSILAWRIPWTEKPSRLQFAGSQRVGHDWVTSLYNYICYITECIAHGHITHWAPVVFLCIGLGPSSAKRTWPHGTYRPFWAMLHGIPGFLSGKDKSCPSNKKQDGSPNPQYHRMCPHSETVFTKMS